MKKIIVGLALLALVGAGVWFYFGSARRAASPALAPLPGSVAGPVKAGTKVQATAHVVPARFAKLAFPTGGVVAEVLVREGEPVQAGQVIARLAAERQQAAVQQAQAALQQAQAKLADVQAAPREAEVAALQAAVDLARANLDRLKQGATAAEIAPAEVAVLRAQAALLAQQTRDPVDDQALQVAQAELVAAQAQLQQLKAGPTALDLAGAAAQVRQAEANLALRLSGPRGTDVAAAQAGVAAAEPGVAAARAALQETELRAPFDGTLAVLDLKVGEFVQAGAAQAQLADRTGYRVETEDLTEAKVVALQVGAPVTLKFDALPGLTLPGKVTQVKGLGEKKQGDVLFTVTIAPDQLDSRLRWNMTANVTFE